MTEPRRPPGPTILVVEDEPEIGAVLEDYLRSLGEVVRFDRGDAVVEHVRRSPPDVIVLDVMLPGQDGLSVCRDIRRFSDVPIVMVTAKVEEIDRLLGLELGADDYVCKPFYPREVVARVKRLLERRPGAAATADALQIDEARFEAVLDGQALTLTPVEFRLLAALARRPGHVLGRDRLMDEMYPDRRVVSDRTIDTHVRNLRAKLLDARPGDDPIRSVYGVGYRLELPPPEAA